MSARLYTDANAWVNTSDITITDAPHRITLEWTAAISGSIKLGMVTGWDANTLGQI